MATGTPRLGKLLALALALVCWASPVLACDPGTPCRIDIDGGDYLASVPKAWDGRSPLPTVVFLHGYSQSAGEMLADEKLVGGLSAAGVLLVAPDGQKTSSGVLTWSFPGDQSLPRDDFDFLRRVVDDVTSRWPVDRARLLGSGFSVGGSMIWYVACRMPHRFAGFAPIAGAFWAPEPEACPGGPVDMRHVHGTDDHTVPMQGRSLRGGLNRQGDVLRGIATWRRIDGCPEAPTREETQGRLVCKIWDAKACTSGHELQLCLHGGDHEFDADWVMDGVRWLASRARRTTGASQ